MDLQISRALLLLILFQSSLVTIITTMVLQSGDTHIKINEKECIDGCEDGSMNSGISKSAFTCCGTHFCSSRDAPDPRTNAPNGRACYYCDGEDCSKTVRCSGTEDRCITATVTNRGLTMLVKGCISKNICGALNCSFIGDVSCCEGDLCNADKSITRAVTQSFRNNADESVTQRLAYNDAKNFTERLTYYHAKRVRPKFSTKRFYHRAAYNNVKSVTQSFLFSALLLPVPLNPHMLY